MARKKDVKPPIINGLEEEYIVEKARPLMLMKEVPFALGELKVLDTYLSRINARDPEATTVRFSKEEYEDLMGIERMRPERLGKYVDSLMGKVITVPDENMRGGWKKYTLFSTSVCSQDENGQWWIDLSCTTEAKTLFFNIDAIGYIRYQLKNVLPLTSKYSVLLYIYLLDNRFRSSWEISLKELRETVFRVNTETYEDFKYFKRDILEKSIKEVNAKTDLTFAYEPIKAGRKISKIKFRLIKDEVTLSLEEDPNQINMFNYLPTEDIENIQTSITEQREQKILKNIRPIFEMINPKWQISDDQILEINDMIYEEMLKRHMLNDLQDSVFIEIERTKMLERILRKAKSGGAKHLYPWLMKVWDNIIETV